MFGLSLRSQVLTADDPETRQRKIVVKKLRSGVEGCPGARDCEHHKQQRAVFNTAGQPTHGVAIAYALLTMDGSRELQTSAIRQSPPLSDLA